MQTQLKGYLYEAESKKYFSDINIDADPLESLAQKKFVPLMPANCTLIAPPEEKEGFDRIWNGAAWEYKEQKKEEPVHEEYTPTELEETYQKLYAAQAELAEMDYIGVKIATGRATAEQYADKIERMNVLAEEINTLRDKITILEGGTLLSDAEPEEDMAESDELPPEESDSIASAEEA